MHKSAWLLGLFLKVKAFETPKTPDLALNLAKLDSFPAVSPGLERF
jgi:hypothetical protein